MMKKIVFTIGLFLTTHNAVSGFYDLYDSFVYQPVRNPKNKRIIWSQVSGHYENMRAYNQDGKRQDPLQLFSVSQDSLAALEGFSADSIQGQRLSQIDAASDGVRGILLLNGSLKMNWGFTGGIIIPFMTNWSYRSLIGVYHFSLNNVSILDLTKDQSIEDFRTKQFLTNDIVNNAKILGTGLLLQDWSKTGLGDWMNYFVWEKEFDQERLFLESVKLSLRAGLSISTGKKTDPDYLLEFSYGNDGSVGVPFGAALQFSINDYISCGLDFELLYLFGKTQVIRLKTSENQTEPLLFAKEFVYKEPGMQQRLDMYAQFSDSKKQVVVTIGYHYHKKGDDTITIQSANFSNLIAHRAISLQDSTAHHAIVALALDGSSWSSPVSAQCNLFAKVPFNGSNRLVGSTVGVGLGINF